MRGKARGSNTSTRKQTFGTDQRGRLVANGPTKSKHSEQQKSAEEVLIFSGGSENQRHEN